jgi:hypothetical protein
MVAEAARGAHHDMRATRKEPAFRPHIGTRDARHDARAGLGIEPVQFHPDLQRQLPCRCDHQGQRGGCRSYVIALLEDLGREGQAIDHCLA